MNHKNYKTNKIAKFAIFEILQYFSKGKFESGKKIKLSLVFFTVNNGNFFVITVFFCYFLNICC